MDSGANKFDRKSIQFIIQCIFSAFSQYGAIYASPLLGIRKVYTEGIPTAAICPSAVYFNPKFMDTLQFPEGTFVAAHEGCHLAFLHPFRKERLFAALNVADQSDYLWNYAADIEINGFLQADNVGKMPDDCVPGKTHTTAEREYLELLDQIKKKNGGQLPRQPGAMPGGGGDPESRAQQGTQDPGYGLPGKPLDHVDTPHNEDGTEMTPSQMQEAEMEAKAALQAAVDQHMKQKGTLPAGMEQIIDGVFASKRDWKEILAQYVSTVYCKEDWSFRRPNARRSFGRFVMPSLHSPAPGRVAVCCDTSGSVSNEELEEICSEVMALISMYNDTGTEVPLDVIWFDSEAYHDVVYSGDELVPKGRGGTSFRAALDKAAELEEQPEAIIFATDGYDSRFGKAPDCPVLWVITKNGMEDFNPPFGEVVVKQ